MTYAKFIFLLALLVVSACGKHEADNSSFIRPSQKTAGDASNIFSDIKTDKMVDFKEKLNKITDINVVYDDGNTLLTYATKENKVEFVKLLIENGADTTVTDSDGQTALDIAVAKADEGTAIKLIIDPSLQPEEQEKLFNFVLKNKVGDVKKKLQAGVDPNFVHASGETPFTQAVQLKNANGKYVGVGLIRTFTTTKNAEGLSYVNYEMPNAAGLTGYQIAVQMNEASILTEFKKLGYP